MWEMILEYIWLILEYTYHYLKLLLPYLLVYTGITLFGLPGFFIGRFYERHLWWREIKSGRRLGELIEGQLKKRDDLIEQQKTAIEIREEQAELMEIQQKRLVGLSHEIDEVATGINFQALKRRRRA
ncbi:hypothetical protein LCGC14_1991870 [marine sediment metagenome]|uniref:Uncharacterized protein n=1 Tax=marine sediment metagenome TaxID=412755 RepID=A0A0F9HJ74_9ZZZZ